MFSSSLTFVNPHMEASAVYAYFLQFIKTAIMDMCLITFSFVREAMGVITLHYASINLRGGKLCAIFLEKYET